MSADAILSSPDALPIGDILRAITPVESELLRLLLLLPDEQVRVIEQLRPEELPSTVARELYQAIIVQRDAGRGGKPAGRSISSDSWCPSIPRSGAWPTG